ncbi:chitin-binding domain protein cbd-1-like [Babylonia areolata]|uniref:chitin-binding domain protein cbd-1-like n=1 Tax=Babylonia areolata TaxID=304850 RepID=UPI003FD0D06C
MKGLLCLLFVSVVAPTVWTFDCSGVPNGVYEEACKTFVICRNGVGTLVECPFPTVSNGGSWHNISCVDPWTVGPPCGLTRDCTKLQDGRYADLVTNCTSYFTCTNGFYYGHNYCSEGLIFNEPLGICDWPSATVTCRTSAPDDPIG